MADVEIVPMAALGRGCTLSGTTEGQAVRVLFLSVLSGLLLPLVFAVLSPFRLAFIYNLTHLP